MPIYEYQCNGCGGRFEVLQTRPTDPRPRCPECGSESSERLLSAFAVATRERGAPATGPCGLSNCACLRQDQTN
jgi:putative FmdB family regulatory protein